MINYIYEMSKMIFYAMRHGETEGNFKKLVQGQTHDSLNAKGRKQIEENSCKLADKKITLIISSDLKRAKESSEIVSAKIGVDRINYWKIIREKNNGAFTGKSSKKIDWKKIYGTYETRRVPRGESLEDVLRRVKIFIRLLKKNPDEKILVISHGTFLKLLIGHLGKMDIKKSIEEIKIKNAEILKLKC